GNKQPSSCTSMLMVCRQELK
ncbi:hypothetical protein SOVF_060340, partial [Spinacia oleracea]